MEHDHIKSRVEHLKSAALPCPDCQNTPAVSFYPYCNEFKISCCGYVVENAEWEVALGVWNDFVEENVSESNSADKEKTPNGIISQCPICGGALGKNIYANGTLHIVCKSRRCITIASKDHARLWALLQYEDWRSIAEKTKPCPRCGGDEITIWYNDEKFWIHCEKSGCRAGSNGETSAEALAQWKELTCDEQPQVDAVKGIEKDKKEKDPSDYSAEYQITPPAERSEDKISDVVEHLREMLIVKNQNYGNSAFSSPVLLPYLKPKEALLVRMSDKVARLASLASGEKDRVGESIEDTLYDLAGYCVFAIIAMEKDG